MIDAQTPDSFSWLREVLVPTLFTILGAALGFIVSQVRDDQKAKRARESFIRAIGMELDALGNQLDASLYEVRGAAARLRTAGSAPQFAYAFRTSVFTSQVGKLRDVDDLLMIEIIHFYSDFGTLEHIFETVNELSAEFNRMSPPSDRTSGIGSALSSSLVVLEEQIPVIGTRLNKLRLKLPKAPALDHSPGSA